MLVLMDENLIEKFRSIEKFLSELIGIRPEITELIPVKASPGWKLPAARKRDTEGNQT